MAALKSSPPIQQNKGSYGSLMARAIFNYIQITFKYANGRNVGRREGARACLWGRSARSQLPCLMRSPKIFSGDFSLKIVEKVDCVRLLIGPLPNFDFWNPTVATTLLTRPLYSAQVTPRPAAAAVPGQFIRFVEALYIPVKRDATEQE
jgi:hypothetical protein